jgi:hypothetical protein
VRKLIVCVFLLLAACHDKRPPQPTERQSQELNDAEDMLNGMAQNEEGPEANASSPSNSSD